MISKEEFIRGIKSYKEGLGFIERADSIGLDLYESPICSTADTIFDMWLDQITTDAGADLIYWWLFEDVEKKIYKDDEVIADLVDEESLYNYMNENGYF